ATNEAVSYACSRSVLCLRKPPHTVSTGYTGPYRRSFPYARRRHRPCGPLLAMTCTLKCSACRASIVHALLRDDAAPQHRDMAETRQFTRGGLLIAVEQVD